MSCCLSFIVKNRRPGAKKLFKKSASEAGSASPKQLEEEDGPLLVAGIPPAISPTNREERIFLKVLQTRERLDFNLPPSHRELTLDDEAISTPKSPTSFTEDSPRKVQECMKTMFGRRISHMDEKIQNILKRHPDKTREEVAAALVQNNGHAGSACQELRHQGLSPVASALGSSHLSTEKPREQDRFGTFAGTSESTLAQSPLTSTTSDSTPFQVEESSGKVANLLRRFPQKSRAQVLEALERCDGHAGQVSIMFSREASGSKGSRT